MLCKLPVVHSQFAFTGAESAFLRAEVLAAIARENHKEIAKAYPDIEDGMLFSDFMPRIPRSPPLDEVIPSTPASPQLHMKAFGTELQIAQARRPMSFSIGHLPRVRSSPGQGNDGVDLPSQGHKGSDSALDAEKPREPNTGPSLPKSGSWVMHEFCGMHFPAAVIDASLDGVKLEWASYIVKGSNTPIPSRFVIPLAEFLQAQSVVSAGSLHPDQVRS